MIMTRNLFISAPHQLPSAGLVLALFATACFGCASQSKKESKFAAWDVRRAVGLKKDDEKPEPQIPSRLVATWTETVLNKAGEKPLRGFGGRIAFFKQASEDPVRVDGQLVVYAFDETSRPSHETHPTRKYIFPAEQVVRHESESKVGPSYSFWLPWDEVGGLQRNISLIARFEPKGGPIVIGEQTKHFLPGASPDVLPAPQLAGEGRSEVVNAVRLATYSHQAAASVPDLADPPMGEASSARPQMSTATIAIPRGLGLPAGQQPSTAINDPAAAGIPLSQLSSLGKGAPAALVTGERVPSTPLPAAEAARPTAAAAAAPAGPAAPGSLRDSLLGTLPARARQGVPATPGRAR
jgi:hypothetical protein